MDLNESFLEQYVEEALENIEELVNGLLRLENEDGDEAAHTVKELFRFAHNLKGMSGAMALDGITTVAHKMEDLLDKYRQGEGVPSSDEVDVLLSASDAMQGMVEDAAGGANPEAPEDLVQQLASHGSGSVEPPAATPTAPAESEPQSVAPSSSLDLPTAPDGAEWVVLNLREGAQLLGARSAMVIQGAQRHGEVVNLVPERSEIEAGRALEFALCVADCDEMDTLVEFFESITDIESAVVVAESPEGLLEEAASDELRLEVKLDSEVQLAGARSATILQYLVQRCTVTSTNPDRQMIEAGKAKTFVVGLTGVEDVEALIEGVSSFGDVEAVNQIATEERREDERRKGERRSATTAAAPRATIRVDTDRLDDLMDLVSELVVGRGQLDEHAGRIGDRPLVDSLSSIHRTISDLQAMVAKVRMISLEKTFARLTRIVRDTARDVGKDVNFVTSGEDTELDRSMIDTVADPLMHLLRNSVDHGIEADESVRVAAGKSAQGQVGLRAFTEGNQVVIEVTDDGGGISVEQVVAKAIRNGLVSEDQAATMPHQEKLDLVFEAGLSTRESASTISGRGVGMDVVRSAAVKLGGNVTIESTPGKGSIFTIRLPLSLAVAEALLVKVARETWAIPIDQIEETLAVQPEDVRTVRGQAMIDIRGEIIPLVHGAQALYGEAAKPGVKEA
ncbi:MAG: ATP-binding protein, partial [Acidimicrobiales bacterium]